MDPTSSRAAETRMAPSMLRASTGIGTNGGGCTGGWGAGDVGAFGVTMVGSVPDVLSLRSGSVPTRFAK